MWVGQQRAGYLGRAPATAQGQIQVGIPAYRFDQIPVIQAMKYQAVLLAGRLGCRQIQELLFQIREIAPTCGQQVQNKEADYALCLSRMIWVTLQRRMICVAEG